MRRDSRTLIVLGWFLFGCSSGSTSSSDGATTTGSGAGSSGGPTYDAMKCHKANADPSVCTACCEADLPGKSAHDYFNACEGHLTPTSDSEWYFPCKQDACQFETVDVQHCKDRVACEEECTCERCGGTTCVDFFTDPKNCSGCGITCIGSEYCIDGYDGSVKKFHQGQCYAP